MTQLYAPIDNKSRKMRFSLFGVCAVIELFFIFNLTSSYDLYDGHDFGTRMSYTEVKKHGLLFFRRQETLIFNYPPDTNITGIACMDISPDKKGIATILEGGVGKNFVKLHFESETSVGLRFIIEIYTAAYKFIEPNSDQNLIDII